MGATDQEKLERTRKSMYIICSLSAILSFWNVDDLSNFLSNWVFVLAAFIITLYVSFCGLYFRKKVGIIENTKIFWKAASHNLLVIAIGFICGIFFNHNYTASILIFSFYAGFHLILFLMTEILSIYSPIKL